MAKQMCVCRIERVDGDGGGLGTETKRKYSDGRDYSPNNVTKERSHLNREIIGKGDPALHGGNYIVSAINGRLAGADLKRKVGSNQCRALIAYLSGTHDQMMEIVNQGKLDDWVEANVKWLHQTFGKENVVAVDLHLDEYTPHLHAIIVPITSAPRARRSREGEAKYVTSPSKNRLCADDLMKKDKLIGYQDSYAEAMRGFGLARGVHGSKARHQTMNEYYRTLQEERIPEAERSLASVEDEIKEKKVISSQLTDEHKRKRKKIDQEKGSAIRRGVANLFGKSVDEVVKERDKTIDELKAELADERKERRALKKQIEAMGKPLSDKQRQEMQERIDTLNESIKDKNSKIKQLLTIVNGEPQRIAQAKNEGRTEGKTESAAAAQQWQRKYKELEAATERKINNATSELREENTILKAEAEQADAFLLSVGQFLYASWSLFKESVSAIGNFISECMDSQYSHRDILNENEAALFRQVGKPFDWSYFFAKMIGKTAQAVFGWNDYKTQRAINEINDVFEGRYDRIISRHLGR